MGGSFITTRTIRFAVVYVIIAAGCFFVYFTPKAKYQGKEVVLSVMESVPDMFGRWRGKDVDVDIDEENPIYNFLSRVFARFYRDLYMPEQGVFFMLLDAGNFHYPRICMRGVGVNPQELAPRKINVKGRDIPVYLVFSEGEESSNLTVYWICIDKKVVTQWINQKVHQLFYSLFNKKSVGLMVRADVTCSIDNIDEGVKYVEKFFSDMYRDLPEESREYLFGS